MSVTREELEQFDEDFEGASGEQTGGDYAPIQDGNYTVDVEAVELTRTKNTDRPMLKWKLRINGSVNSGRVMFRNNVLATGKNMEFLKKDLYLCGLAITKLSELPGRLAELLDLRLKVRKVTKGEFENIYFQERVEVEAAKDDLFSDGPDMPPAGPDNSDYPF